MKEQEFTSGNGSFGVILFFLFLFFFFSLQLVFNAMKVLSGKNGPGVYNIN